MLITLHGAPAHILALPADIQQAARWQTAAGELMKAAEYAGLFLITARISFGRALAGDDHRAPPAPGGRKSPTFRTRKIGARSVIESEANLFFNIGERALGLVPAGRTETQQGQCISRQVNGADVLHSDLHAEQFCNCRIAFQAFAHSRCCTVARCWCFLRVLKDGI